VKKISRSPWASSPSSWIRIEATGASRLPVGAPSTAQQNPNAATVFASYFGLRGLRVGFTSLGFNAAANALRA